MAGHAGGAYFLPFSQHRRIHFRRRALDAPARLVIHRRLAALTLSARSIDSAPQDALSLVALAASALQLKLMNSINRCMLQVEPQKAAKPQAQEQQAGAGGQGSAIAALDGPPALNTPSMTGRLSTRPSLLRNSLSQVLEVGGSKIGFQE